MNLKSDFPVFSEGPLYYFDSAATSLTPRVVSDAMQDFYMQTPANVHRGSYTLSHLATEKYEAARNKVAEFIHADPEEVIFTSGASHALNMVASMVGSTLKPGDEIVTSELEHHSNFLPWQKIAREKNCLLKFIELTQDGEVKLDNLKKVLSEKTKVIALTAVSNTMGTTTPLKAIKELVGDDVMVIADAAQAIPHGPLDVKDLNVDFLAFSGHKVCGPNGIGVLYGKIKHLNELEPYMVGGEMNDYVSKDTVTYKDPPLKFETGTPPIAEAIGLARAITYMENLGFEATHQHVLSLKTLALKQMHAMNDIEIYNPNSSGTTILFNIKGVHPHDAVTALDEHHVAIRAGHHCAQLVMQWLDVSSTLRASFYIYNSIDDVNHLINGLEETIEFFKDVDV